MDSTRPKTSLSAPSDDVETEECTPTSTCANPDQCESGGHVYVVQGGTRAVALCKMAKARRTEQRAAKVVLSSRISPKFRTRTFETFQHGGNASLKLAWESASAWANNYIAKAPDQYSGIGFYGPVGTGKTHLLAAILNRLMAAGHAGVFVAVPDLMGEIKNAMDGGRPEAIIDHMRQAPLIFLDDMGAEKPTDYQRETLFRIINYRYEQLLPTCYSSNLHGGQLANHIGMRAVSRLNEMTQNIEVEAPDFRLKG